MTRGVYVFSCHTKPPWQKQDTHKEQKLRLFVSYSYKIGFRSRNLENTGFTATMASNGQSLAHGPSRLFGTVTMPRWDDQSTSQAVVWISYIQLCSSSLSA